jgi:hypothetical protein
VPYYKYLCEVESCQHFEEMPLLKISEHPGTTKPCAECGGTANQVIETPGMVKIYFERNGRKAVSIKAEGGKEVIRSGTREKWEHDTCNRPAAEYKHTRTQTVWSNSVQKEVDRRKKESESNANSRRNKKR